MKKMALLLAFLLVVSFPVSAQAATPEEVSPLALKVYDYALNADSTVYKIYQDTVSSSMTGLSPGVTYEQKRLTVGKKDIMHILSDLSYTLTYYLLIDNIIQLGTEDFRYQFTHDVTTDAVTYKQIV